ncbi:MAG: sugar ABC transporter permease [Nitrososphaeria archaeon]
MKKLNTGLILSIPALIYLFFWFFFPFLYNIYASMHYWTMYNPNIQFIWFENYISALMDIDFRNALLSTFWFTIICFIVELPLGLGIAMLISRDFRGVGIIRLLIAVPILMIPIGVSIMWKLLTMPKLGLLQYFSEVLGFGVIDFYGNFWFASLLILLIDAWQWTPFFTIVLLAALLSLPKEPYEAARIDCASPFTIFTRITLPSIKPVIVIVSILRILDLLKLTDPILVVTKAGSGTETLSAYIYRVAFKPLDIGYGGAVAVLYWILMFILANILVRRFKSVIQ